VKVSQEKSLFKKIRQNLRQGIYIFALFCAVFTPYKPAAAQVCADAAAVPALFLAWRQWLTEGFAKGLVIPQLQKFAEQMSTIAMHQAFTVGTFLDAKHQLETQRLFQELQIQAHKDYIPSTSFCTLGTAARSLAHSESVGRYNALVLSRRQLARHLGQANTAGAADAAEDKEARWKMFSEVYCDPKDNNAKAGDPNSGLGSVCISGARNADRINIDVDYTRMIENRRTLDLSYPFYSVAPDELDVMSLGNNLYGHDVLFRVFSEASVDDENKNHVYMDLRSIAAKRSVAENSFNAIVGLKSLGSAGGSMNNSGVNTYKFLGRILMDLGIPEAEVKAYLGQDPNTQTPPDLIPDPSYFAQLEILSKKIYQTPYFFANLYDTPTNVKRKSAALKAIELMLDRAIFESQLRQEMSLSVLLSSKLQKNFDDANDQLGN
jgi:hypothetical protein